jgi:hypothetical protein
MPSELMMAGSSRIAEVLLTQLVHASIVEVPQCPFVQSHSTLAPQRFDKRTALPLKAARRWSRNRGMKTDRSVRNPLQG